MARTCLEEHYSGTHSTGYDDRCRINSEVVTLSNLVALAMRSLGVRANQIEIESIGSEDSLVWEECELPSLLGLKYSCFPPNSISPLSLPQLVSKNSVGSGGLQRRTFVVATLANKCEINILYFDGSVELGMKSTKEYSAPNIAEKSRRWSKQSPTCKRSLEKSADSWNRRS